jgi:nuclear pore complex protein Nup160
VEIGAILTAETIVSRLAHSGRFRTAMSTATSLEVDMSDLFLSLTEQCLLLSREPSAVPCVAHSPFHYSTYQSF